MKLQMSSKEVTTKKRGRKPKAKAKEEVSSNLDIAEKKEVNNEEQVSEQVSEEVSNKKVITIEQAINNQKLLDIKDVEWWKKVDNKSKFQLGDIVYISDINKFALFLAQSNRDGLAKIQLIKNRDKTHLYSRYWYLPFENMQLVKRKNVVKRGFKEEENAYVKK